MKIYSFFQIYFFSFNSSKGLPLRVPGLRVDQDISAMQHEVPPSRAQYLEGLCRLRNLSLAKNLPSAFVIALSLLRVKKVSMLTKFWNAY